MTEYSPGRMGELEELCDQLHSALERTETNFKRAVDRTPVRDMAENLAENAAAMSDYADVMGRPASTLGRTVFVDSTGRQWRSDDEEMTDEYVEELVKYAKLAGRDWPNYAVMSVNGKRIVFTPAHIVAMWVERKGRDY